MVQKGSGHIQIIVHSPESEASRAALARRIAEVHAEAVGQAIRSLHCPAAQKQALFRAIRADAAEPVSRSQE